MKNALKFLAAVGVAGCGAASELPVDGLTEGTCPTIKQENFIQKMSDSVDDRIAALLTLAHQADGVQPYYGGYQFFKNGFPIGGGIFDESDAGKFYVNVSPIDSNDTPEKPSIIFEYSGNGVLGNFSVVNREIADEIFPKGEGARVYFGSFDENGNYFGGITHGVLCNEADDVRPEGDLHAFYGGDLGLPEGEFDLPVCPSLCHSTYDTMNDKAVPAFDEIQEIAASKQSE